MKLQIVQMKLSEIKPYENNPRLNDAAIEKVANSIKEFGFNNPILVDKGHSVIAGHTRYKAAQQLELENVPVIVLSTLTPEQAKAFRIADNKTAEYAEWDANLLHIELQELNTLGFDLLMTGFEQDEVNSLMKSFTDLPENLLGDFDNQEINLSEYEEKEFDCKCPKCGFLFNQE